LILWLLLPIFSLFFGDLSGSTAFFVRDKERRIIAGYGAGQQSREKGKSFNFKPNHREMRESYQEVRRGESEKTK